MDSPTIEQLSQSGRLSIQKGDWADLSRCAEEILNVDPASPEGYFFRGWYQKVSRQPRMAIDSFEQVLRLDEGRYDAAIELANQLCMARRNAQAKELLDRYAPALSNSPRYLDLAGTTYVTLGLAEQAWPLYVKANELQPDIELFQANLASCAVYLGKIDEAEATYRALLSKNPWHQRNHYQLARLKRAENSQHVEQMRELLAAANLPPDKNVFLQYAIGKELEDLEQWEQAFSHYKQAGDGVATAANYSVRADTDLIDKIIETSSADWYARSGMMPPVELRCQPIFICGLPRTGTTLTERVLASHSDVQSIGETQYIEVALRQISGVETTERMNADILEAAQSVDPALLAQAYYDYVSFQLGEQDYFIEKLPYNFLFLGHIAKAFPDGKIVHLRRHPVDACFAMFKQVFTWAYKFSYQLDDLAEYYIAYDKLMTHWRTLLGDRLIEVKYEDLVGDFEGQTRQLLDRLGLTFESACLEFEKNRSASTTASSVQVREKAHSRSINRWKHFETQLQPLVDRLTQAGISI